MEKLIKELDKLNENIQYWTDYNAYKALFENKYALFFLKKKQGLTFNECFLVFSSICNTQLTKAEIDAFEDVKKNLNF
jgi:hypothetical protein